MKSATHRSSNSNPGKNSNKSLEWAKFELFRRVVNSLLLLLWLFILVMLVLFATGRIKIADAVVGILISATIGCVGTVLTCIFKSWRNPK